MNWRVKCGKAQKNRDAQAFLKVVDKNAVMVCGGFRCNSADYAEIIKKFECSKMIVAFIWNKRYVEYIPFYKALELTTR